MQFPELTSIYAAFLALIYVVLSVWVIVGRGQTRVMLGSGNDDGLNIRIRSHANFGEYVPLILILVAMLEASHTSRFTIHLLLLPLVIARLAHPLGLMAPNGSVQQGVLRGGGIAVTLLVLLVSAVLLLLRPFS